MEQFELWAAPGTVVGALVLLCLENIEYKGLLWYETKGWIVKMANCKDDCIKNMPLCEG